MAYDPTTTPECIKDCVNCARSEYREFNEWGSNRGLYCKYARMRVKNATNLKCYKEATA